MKTNIFSKIHDQNLILGSWLQIPSSDVAEILGYAGYDWVAIDLEHGTFSLESLTSIFRALETGGTVPLARIARCHPKDIKQALDAGAKGLILPNIENGQQLEDAINWAHYPPKGIRGVGYSRASLFGKKFAEYLDGISSDIFIVAQIEHINAVNNLDDILTVDGLHASMIGPYDLSGSMNLTAQFSHPEFIKAVEAYLSKSKEHKIPAGIHVVEPDAKQLESRIKEGFRFIAYGTDAVFLYNGAQCPPVI